MLYRPMLIFYEEAVFKNVGSVITGINQIYCQSTKIYSCHGKKNIHIVDHSIAAISILSIEIEWKCYLELMLHFYVCLY